MKDGNFYEIGERPRQGRRTDLDLIRFDIENGISDLEIAKKNFSQWCYHRRSFGAYRDLVSKYDTQLVVYDLNVLTSNKAAGQYLRKANSIHMDSMTYSWTTFYSNKYEYIVTPRTTALMDTLDCAELDNNNVNYIIV